jgi:coproporphyrinogen III oxidase
MILTRGVRHQVQAALLIFMLPAFAGLNDGVEGLNQDQQAFAARTLKFLDDMDAKHFGRAAEIDPTLQNEQKTFDYDFARYEAHVGRGEAIEKIGRMTGIVYKPTGDVQSPTVFGRYFGIDVHPKNPNLGMLHAAFLVQYYPNGRSAIGGTLNVLPGAFRDEDLDAMKAALDEVAEKHGVDIEPLRKRVCAGTEMAVDAKYRRRLACVGASFFGYPMLAVNEENFLFVTEAYDHFVETFLMLVDKRKNEPFTDEHIAKQDAMRRNWLEDQLFTDPYAASGITPYEVWSLTFSPPVVKF